MKGIHCCPSPDTSRRNVYRPGVPRPKIARECPIGVVHCSVSTSPAKFPLNSLAGKPIESHQCMT
jgi:hypothetical protein